MEDFFYKYREHASGINIYEREEVTPPTHLWKIKKVKLVGEIYSESRRELIAEVLRAEAGDPIAACKRHDSLELVTYPGKMRKGHPRDIGGWKV